jgi:hypothetical protein
MTNPKLIKSSEVKVGDKIRFSPKFLEWYSTIVGQECIDESPNFYSSYQEVKTVNTTPICPEETHNFFFSNIPGDGFFMCRDEDSKVEFPIEKLI